MKRFAMILISVFVIVGAFCIPGESQSYRPGQAGMIVNYPALPATCIPQNGQVVYLTTGNRGIYTCSERNQWTRLDSSGVLNVRAFGALGNGVTNDTAAIQAAINAAILVRGSVYVPPGTYPITTLDFRNITPVSNATPFGLKFSGAGMGTMFLHDGLTNPAFNLHTTANDIQVHISDFFVYCPSTTGVIGFELGVLNRYSTFTNIRVYGFQSAFRFNAGPLAPYAAPSQGLTFRNVTLRHSGRGAITSAATSSTIGLKWFGGYIDNNGFNSIGHGGYWAAAHLYRWADCDFYGVIMEGNYGGGLQIDTCIDVRFHGCRFEETIPDYGAGGQISEILATSVRTVFTDCYMAYTSNYGGHVWSMFNISSNTIIERCEIQDSAAGGADFIGASAGGQPMIINTYLNGCTTALGRIILDYATIFANLGTPANGSSLYCSDCTIANPCAGGGTGSIAKRLNGVWVCN